MDVTARCIRADARWWAIEVPEVPGALTQVESLDDAAWMAADAVATVLEIDPATVRVRVIVEPAGVPA